MNRASGPQTSKQTEFTSQNMVTVHCTYVQNCPQNDVNFNAAFSVTVCNNITKATDF